MDELEQKAIELAIAEAKKSNPEDAAVHPLVGAVLIRPDGGLVSAYRGAIATGEHAEYTLLERKLFQEDIAGATLVTTLEPCTSRNHPKCPCAKRIISRKIGKVLIGMLDPNDDIYGKGLLQLREAGLVVEMFPPAMATQVRDDNLRFIELHDRQTREPSKRRLDDWFYSINRTYFGKNFYRSTESIFLHLIEVMGGLSLLASDKNKPGVIPRAHIPKAIAWWLALCGKLSIRSVEDVLWYKFPYACPYCELCPHNQDKCAEVKERAQNPDWSRLLEIGLNRAGKRPTTLGGWLEMFNEIYPSSQTEKYDVIFARFTEELGEGSEAVRIGSIVPGYIISEFADIFAWLMKLTNTFCLRTKIPAGKRGEQLENWFQDQYPDKCVDCGNSVCNCPPILTRTLGRIAHDGPSADLLVSKSPFLSVSENSARFDITSTHIVIGERELPVSDALITEVAKATSGILDQIQGGMFDSEKQKRLHDAFQRLRKFSENRNINTRNVDNLLRIIRLLELSELQSLSAQLGRSKSGGWVDALQQFVQNEIAKQEGETPSSEA